VVEHSNSICYISDMETYELLHLTKAGMELYGMTRPEEYLGKKCYKVIMGLDEPCPFCTNSKLKEGQEYQAVYSADLFHDIIRGLEDADRQYLNAEVMRKSSETERVWLIGFLILIGSLLVIINSVYAISCIRVEEKKRRKRIEKQK